MNAMDQINELMNIMFQKDRNNQDMLSELRDLMIENDVLSRSVKSKNLNLNELNSCIDMLLEQKYHNEWKLTKAEKSMKRLDIEMKFYKGKCRTLESKLEKCQMRRKIEWKEEFYSEFRKLIQENNELKNKNAILRKEVVKLKSIELKNGAINSQNLQDKNRSATVNLRKETRSEKSAVSNASMYKFPVDFMEQEAVCSSSLGVNEQHCTAETLVKAEIIGESSDGPKLYSEDVDDFLGFEP